MNSSKSKAHDANDQGGPVQTAGTGHQAVELSFRIGSVPVSLADLASMRRGYVFTTQSTARDAQVDIYLGEQKVGTGRLAEIDQRLGVQVTRWGGEQDGE